MTLREEFRETFPPEVYTFEDNAARIETRLVTVGAIENWWLSKLDAILDEITLESSKAPELGRNDFSKGYNKAIDELEAIKAKIRGRL